MLSNSPNKIVSGGPRPARARAASAELPPLGRLKVVEVFQDHGKRRTFELQLVSTKPHAGATKC